MENGPSSSFPLKVSHDYDTDSSLKQILSESQLSTYYTALTSKLKLQNAQHLKFVTESDLTQIGECFTVDIQCFIRFFRDL